MNLTFEVNETNYTILNNGRAWIVQDTYIPYPGETVEESAQNHINEILKENAMKEEEVNEINQMQEDNTFIAETLALALMEIELLKEEVTALKGAQ